MASSSRAPKEWSVIRRESNRNCSRVTLLWSSTRVIKTHRVVDICVKTQSRIPTIDENTTNNTLSSTTSLKFWRQYLPEKGKNKLSLRNVPTAPLPPAQQCCGANQAASEKKKTIEGGREGSRLLRCPTKTIYLPIVEHLNYIWYYTKTI